MPENIATIQTAFQVQQDAITTLDAALAAETKTLTVGAFKQRRELTPAEVSRLDQITATRSGLAKALSKLALDTLGKLDTAPELKKLLADIKAVNADLVGSIEHLKTIAGYAAVVANVVAMAEKAVSIIASLRPGP